MNVPAPRMGKVEPDPHLISWPSPTRAAVTFGPPQWLRFDPIRVRRPDGEVTRTGHAPDNLDVLAAMQRQRPKDEHPKASMYRVESGFSKSLVKDGRRGA